jgi:hypothetical protein
MVHHGLDRPNTGSLVARMALINPKDSKIDNYELICAPVKPL